MDIGPGEIVAILAVALLFLGPAKLPSLGRALGESLHAFRAGSNGPVDAGAGGETR